MVDALLNRRSFIGGLATIGLSSCLKYEDPGVTRSGRTDWIVRDGITHVPADPNYYPVPSQVPVTKGSAKLPGIKLSYWDTGGDGDAILLLHPATGSSEIWDYQQPVFAKAGYRVISYSRRGHFKSERGSEDNKGTYADDLAALLDFLKVDRCHLVGSALGGAAASDFVLSFPDRVLSVTYASSLCGIDEPSFRQKTRDILPPDFRELPADFRELSPSYRAAHVKGTRQWLELEKYSRNRIRQNKLSVVSFEALSTISVPILILTGASDLYFPPPRLKAVLPFLSGATAYIFEDTGHASHWEQPNAFNEVLLDFIQKAS